MTQSKNLKTKWDRLNRRIVGCTSCPRLVRYCQEVAETKRKSFAEEDYWGKPVPNFGDENSRILIVGLAPAAHGANRTGRMFTGDRSGDFLFAAMHRVGLCNQPESIHGEDGLELKGCSITAICHCAPPANKPGIEELSNCRLWLEETIGLLETRVFVALGQLAWKAIIRMAYDREWISSKSQKFGHGESVKFDNGMTLVGSYHPSQQNTFTGKLTLPMLTSVFKKAIRLSRS